MIGAAFAAGKTELFVRSKTANFSVFVAEKVAARRDFFPKNVGIFAAEKMSDPRQIAKKSFSGILAADFLSEKSPNFSNDFSQKLILFQKIDAVLKKNPRAEISGKKAAEKFLALKKTTEKLLKSAEKLASEAAIEKRYFQKIAAEKKEKIATLEKKLSKSFAENRAEESATLFDEIVAARQKKVAADENARKMAAIESRLSEKVLALKRRKIALEKNRAALIAGVVVDEKTAREAGILR